MMVRLVIQDRHRPVNLLDKDQSDHLVGKSQSCSTRSFPDAALYTASLKTVRTAHHKYQAFRDRMHFLFQISRKLHGGELLPFRPATPNNRRAAKPLKSIRPLSPFAAPLRGSSRLFISGMTSISKGI